MTQDTNVLSPDGAACADCGCLPAVGAPESEGTPAPADLPESVDGAPHTDDVARPEATASPPEDWLPPPDASPRELHRHFRRQAALASWNDYRLMVLIRRMDACEGHHALGCVSLRQYVQLVCGVSALAARERVRVAVALADLPKIEAALADGRLSYSKVRAITRVATLDNESEWLELARSHTADRIEHIVARTQKGDPNRRYLRTKALNRHTTRLTVDLPAEEMELVMRALTAVRKAAGGKLSASQALVYLAADCLSGETRPVSTAERYTVVVHMGKDGSAWLDTENGTAPLRPQVVERLLCDCSVRLAREDEEGNMMLSQRQRAVPLVTRRTVEIRDGCKCRVPGCQNRVWLDTHHVKPRNLNGRHLRKNLILLCSQHHHMVHERALTIEEGEGGELKFRTAVGWVMGEGDVSSCDADWAWVGRWFVEQEDEWEEGEDDPGGVTEDEEEVVDEGVPAGTGAGNGGEPGADQGVPAGTPAGDEGDQAPDRAVSAETAVEDAEARGRKRNGGPPKTVLPG